MRRRLSAFVAAAGLAGGGLLVSAAPADAAHSCADGIPCYPHVCINITQKPYTVYFC